MEKSALFVGWGAIIAGRETQAKQVLQEALQYCNSLQSANRIESFDVVILEPHGSSLSGFVLLKGDAAKIGTLRLDADFVSVIIGVQLVHQHVRVVGAHTGNEIAAIFKMWDTQEHRLLTTE